MTQMFELGRILKPQGIKGEVKAEFYTDDISRVHDLDHVYFGAGKNARRVRVAGARTSGAHAFLTLEGIADRDAAETLRGQLLYIDRESAAPLPEGAFYIQDLLGLEVRDDKNHQLGTLTDILQTGARDIYVVTASDGAQLLFPAVDDVFISKNPADGRITVRAERLAEIAEHDH